MTDTIVVTGASVVQLLGRPATSLDDWLTHTASAGR
jgi:hypothetical protein